MSLVKLRKYGMNLSGRPLGISTFSIIAKEFQAPYELDLEGVVSMGSSFADEVVAKLAKMNKESITIFNSNPIVRKCLDDVAKDKKFQILYK